MTEQTRKSTNRGLEALLKLVLGEITIEQAEKIIADTQVECSETKVIPDMNDQEPNNTTGV